MGSNGSGGRRRGSIDRDGIYRRRKLVTVEMDAMGGMLFARSEIRAIEDESPGFLGHDRQDIIERHYIVSSKRFGSGGRWEGEVIDVANNTAVVMPEEVLDALRQ